MRISCILAPLLTLFAAAATAQSQSELPTINSVEPLNPKVGDEVTAKGENLGSSIVAALFLTDGKTDIKVAILEQTATSIRFRIPPQARSGRFALMVLTKGSDPKLVELPVKITVEEGGTT
jgi:hypothetical protein